MLAPGELRIAVLIRCPTCHGTTFLDHEGDPDDDETLTTCLRCEGGVQAAAIPVRLLFDALRDGLSDMEVASLVAEQLAAQQPSGHSLLRHLPNDLAPRLFPRR